MMRTEEALNPGIHGGDLVQTYGKNRHDKRGRWLSPRVMIYIEKQCGIFSITRPNGNTIIYFIKET